ncbi:hypothetical protein DTO207G8_8482 [Paecilomyces variotii]|nr:hypothetical protein DTO207G8_8482 [Paecilomyces variotii]KAJ9373359.1 hypothetical protein DTO282E5_2095 [Paecilomyces variotii]KAJ9383226.1 hypothetical protein DTO063F5_5394 [Paecilomyces variotii]
MFPRTILQPSRTGFSRVLLAQRAQATRNKSHTTNFDPEAITPGTSSNVRNPQSSSPEAQRINISRGEKGRSSDTADTRSVQSPVSGRNRDQASETRAEEEPSTTEAAVKNDPNLSEEEKKRNVEGAGRKPMGVEDVRRS